MSDRCETQNKHRGQAGCVPQLLLPVHRRVNRLVGRQSLLYTLI